MFSAALDTSSSTAAFAVRNNETNELVVQLNGVPTGRESAALFQRMIEALEGAHVALNDIRHWTVGMGPGSFTGIRVGAAMVKGVCAGSRACYRGVPTSLAMVVTAAGAADQRVITLHDGRKSEVLVSPYRRDGDSWTADGAPFPTAIASLDQIECDRAVMFTTDRALPLLSAAWKAKVTKLDHAPVTTMLDLAELPFPGTEAEQEATAEPVYVRPAVFVKPLISP